MVAVYISNDALRGIQKSEGKRRNVPRPEYELISSSNPSVG